MTHEDLDYTFYTKYSFARLFLHKVFPNLDKIIYLDTDVIVTSDIAELYNQDINGYALGACQDAVVKKGIEKLKENKFVTRIPGIKRSQSQYDYFNKYLKLENDQINRHVNSGVLLYDLKKAGRLIDQKLPELLKKKFIFPDQDIINIIFKDDKKILDRKFNVVHHDAFQYLREMSKYPVIIHYNGLKPTANMIRPSYYCYWKEISNTPFYYPALEQFIDKKNS